MTSSEERRKYLERMSVRDYTGPYEIPEQIKPITNDILYLINLALDARFFGCVSAELSLVTFDEWSNFNMWFDLELSDNKGPEDRQRFINNIITAVITEIARLDRSAVLTFTLHQNFQKTIRNYKILFESSSEDDPFKE